MEYLYVSDLTIFLATSAICLFIYSTIYHFYKRSSYPPGPIGLPVLGYKPFLTDYPNIKLTKMAQKYGDIFSFYIGPQLVILVSEFNLAKKILSHPSALSRPPNAFDFLPGKGGFTARSGEAWQEQRRFSMQTMRNLGLGRGLWETIIREDAMDFVSEMRRSAGQPIMFKDKLSISQVFNSLGLLFGRHLDPIKDKEDIKMMQHIGLEVLDFFSSVETGVNMPWIRKITKLLNLNNFGTALNSLARFEAILRKEIEKRKRTNEESSNEDFIGCYLQELDRRKSDSRPHHFSIDFLVGDLFMFFVSGQDSTVMTVSWLLLLMAEHQDIQKKIHDEIDKVIGRDGPVFYEDKVKLVYTMASVMEMIRWITIAPLFPPRYVSESFEFENYTIPQGSHVVVNSWAIHHDPRYFEQPMKYKPERFLVDNESKVSKLEGFGAFSFGRRNCPGEGVAMMTVYLYFVSIMQKFKVQAPNGKRPDMTYKFSAGILPKPQKLCFIERR